MEKPLQTLHKSLLSNNYDVPDDYESFEQTLTAKGKEGFQNRYTLWKSLNDNGYDVPDNYDDFAHTLFQPVQSVGKPQQTPTATPQQKPQPQPTSYPQAVKEKLKGMRDNAGQKIVEGLDAIGAIDHGQTQTAEAPDDPVFGTPWGTQGSGTGQGKAYKAFAPGQVRETGDPGTPNYGIPYRPYTQMSAAARDELYRQNDYAVKQVQKMRDEQTRRNKPLVDTGNPDVNNSVIKTQGQWEDELQQGVSNISKSVVTPAVSKAIADFDKKAHEVFEGTQEEGNAYGGLPTGTASGATIFGNIKESNKANDPEKVLNYLKGQMEALYKDQSFIEKVGEEADKMGIDRNEYLEKVVKPQIEADLGKQFDSAMIDKYLPKSGKEYVVSGLSNSIIGMLADAFLETKGQRAYKNQAAAMTEEGQNPYYNPGTGAKLAQMGVSFAADAPFFGVYGKVSGQVAKSIAEREIKNLVAKGLSEGAARSVVGSALENSVGARMKNYIMQHVISGSLTMGGYNLTSEGARQLRDKEFDPMRLAGSTAEGLAVGAAFGITGGASQAFSQPLSGFSKIGAKAAGFGAEAETMYATEELAKMAQGEEGFTNPFEGSVEALEKLGVMKLSGGHLLESAGKKLIRSKEVGAKQVAGETLAELLGQNKSGVRFTDDEKNYIRNSQEGKDLVEALGNMHPDRAIEEVNGKKKFTKEGELQRQVLAENYDRFMNNPEIPSGVKQKVSQMFGGIYRPGLETGATITQNEDGSVILKTRDKDGNCVRDLKFDNLTEAEQWRDQFKSQMSRNDAVNMFNSAPMEVQKNIVNIVKDEISGKTVLDELKGQAGTMKQNRLKRQLEKINQTAEQYEGREMTDEEARNYIQTVIKDGDDAVFNEMYDLIRENTHPSDELDTKRNYWEGQQLSTIERHKAQVDAQLSEERLRLQGDAFAEEVIGAADYPDEKMAELAMRASRGQITGDQLKAALDYYNKESKVRGMMDEALKSVDNQVEAANAYVRRNTHTDSGTLIEGSYQGRNYYVTAGHFQIGPDGKLVPTDNSGLVILRDRETGDIVTANPNDILVNGIQDPNRVIEYNESMEGLRGQLIREADDTITLRPDTPTEAANGDIYMGTDGNMYMAMAVQDEAGNPVWSKVPIDENGEIAGNPMEFDIAEYRKAKSDEKDAAEIPPEEAAAIVENQNVQVDENSLGKGAEGVGSAPDASEAVNIDVSDGEGGGTDVPPSQTEEPRPTSSRIPVDEKGKKIYEQAKPEDTLAELTEKYGEEQAQQMISQIAESTTRALEEIKGRDTSKITDMAELEAYQDEVAAAQKKADYWNGIIRQREAAEAKKQELAKTHIDNMRKTKTLDDLEAAYQAAIKAGVPENELSEVYNAKKAWNNLVNPKEIRNFATDPESQAKWVDEHFDEIVDTYIKAHGNLLDPDKLRDALTPIGYNGKNVPDFKIQGKRLTKAVYDKMLQDAVTSGNRSITLLTGAGGAGKSKATESMDFSDRGIVYDSAFNNVKSLKDAINAAKAAGMTDVQVVAVYNDAATSFGNTIERGLKTGRFLALDYFVREAFMENQGKMAELKQSYPDVDIVCIDNSGNKSTERPDGGRVSVDEAANWDYTVNDAKLNELLDIFENGIDEGRFTEDQIASIGRGLHDVERVIADIKPATIERIGRIERRIRPEDVGDLRPGISREPMQLGGDNVVPTTDGEVQGSSEERPSEGVEGTTGKGAPEETRTNEEAGNGRSDTRPASGSDDDGPEPPAAGGGTAVPATDTGAEGETRTGLPANDGRAGSVSGGSDGTGSSGTGGTESGSGKSEVSPAKRKIYHNTVEANRGRKFTVTLGNGNRSVITIKHIDYKGDAVLIRQDYDPQGNPIGEPRQESYPFDIVGKAIVENKWNKQLDADEELRQNYKYHTRKSGDIPIIDVLTDNEKQQMLDALRSGDTEKAGYLESEFIRNHDKDLVLRGREIRNEKVEKALARSGKGERLRGVREQYRGNDEALSMLEDGAMEPQSIEEYVADALGDVPKMGKGFLAYTSYEKGGNKIVGLKDETGFGGRSFGGDTKGFNPWLAPKGQGISLKQFAERIHESLPEGMQQQYSDQDIRNIIHNVMTGAEKPTDIANYILRNRLEEAEASMRRMEDDVIDHMADDVPVFQKVVDDNSFANRLQRANESVNQEPTDGQKKAGNYKKGHISFGGYDFTIENPAGSVRRGTDADGKPWENKMNNTYGYILGKRGKDGDHLDFFINDKADLDNWNGKVYVVDQVKPDGSFDEHKILYGFDSEAEAREAYLSNYGKDWKGLGKITGVDKATFDKWLDASDYKIKDFADYSIVKHKVEQQMRNFDTALKQLNTRGISIDNQELLDKYGLKNVVLSKTGDHLTLTHFIVDQQGQGYGTRFMEDLARLADEKGWTLALTPGLGFGAKSKKKLEEFYKRFGFVANKGRNADFQTRESMIRRPKEFMEKPENQEKVIRDAVVEYLKSIGIDVSTDWKLGQKILDDYNGVGKLSASKKRAVETASLNPKEGSPADISTADGAKIQKKLESYANKLEKVSNLRKNFLEELAEELGATSDGSKSKYATFITKNGDKVTIRLGNHNATVSYFDYRGEDNGISIVVSRRENEGVKNDGNAHIVEAFYPEIALRKAYGKPLSEIVRSINEALNSGKYNDTTGLAEIEEVNADEIKQHKVYHGSGTEFDAFDHSHMGEGAGSQSFGYGTYVSAGQSVAEGYAHQPTYRVEKEKNQFIDASRAYGRALTALDDAKESGVAVDEAIANAEKAKNEYEEAKRIYEEARKGYLYDVEIPGENEAYYIDYKGMMGDQKDLLDMVDNALTADGWKRQEIDSRTKFTKGDKQIILTPNQSGADLYAELEDALGSDKAASEFLHKTGITGIKYPAGTIMGGGNGATNYVIFNEGDAKITGRTKFFKTPDGHAYGYTYNGKIYVDPRIATTETPIHEYGHLWCEMKRNTAPEEWNAFKKVMLNDKMVQPIIDKVKTEYPELTKEGKEDDFIEEIITQFSGKRGSERLREIANEIAQEKGGIFGKAEAVTAMQRLKSILNRFWEGVANMMGWKYTNANQIADRIMADMLNGIDPRERMRQEASNAIRGQQERHTLMGAHNISEEKLKKAIKHGGLANPSLAVIDTKNGIHTSYGEISLIPKSSLIDAKKGRNAGTYAGDAYTPTYPYVERMATKKGEKSIERIAKEAAGGDEELERHLRNNLFDYAEGNAKRLHLLYLLQKGMNPEIKQERVSHRKEEFDAITKIFGEPKSTMPSDLTKEQSDALVDLMTDLYEKDLRDNAKNVKDNEKVESFIKNRVEAYRKKITDENGRIWFAEGDNFVHDNWRDEQKRNNPKPDWYGTDNEASYRIAKEGLSEDYEKWKEEQLFDDGDFEEKLFAGYDRNGYRKYLPNTVENASRLMNREADTNAYDQHGLNATKSSLLKRMTTLSDIRKARHLLQDEEAYNETQKEMSDELFDIIKQLSDMQIISDNSFSNIDYAEARLQEAITKRDPIGYLNKEYGYDIGKDSEYATQLMNFIEKAKELPAKYFETKFKRPVYLNEFEISVVPENTSPDIVEALKDAGLDVRTYDNTGEESVREENRRKATMDAVSGRDDILFQRADIPEPEMTPEERQYWNKWDAAMTKWKERNAIPADQAEAPEKPRYQQGESALDYAQKLVNWNRQKSLWQTAPKLEDYRQVRDIKDNLEAAREVEKRYPDSPSAKMRRVAAELQQIRSAMNRQKAYDKATVKAVTDFAQEFMKMGFGDNLSRGEMERMLSSVKNATGAKDIKKEVDNIMNILIDNHLRNLDQRVTKLSSTKELSKTAQGVEKQGKLELKGQRMIQAFREAREQRMNVDQIRERMATVSEKMNRNDEEAPMWEQEYEGLSIALQYAENIEGSREEWADLDREYKDAVKEYKASGRSYKNQQEYLESLDQAMQENKIERIGLFGDIIGRLEGNISESMQGAKEFVEREKQRVKHIQDIANFDLAGKDMGAMREKVKGKPANFFLQPLGTFEQMLKQFGSRNANGEGYLYDYFMRNWMDATDKAFLNEQKAKSELDTKAREVFGDKVKRWSDLYDIERNMPLMEVEVFDGEEPKTFKLTQGNLLYIYMADKMTDGRMKLRKMGIDEEKVEQIKEFLDPRLVELGDWLQSEYLPSKRTEYNKVHERMFGAPMAAIDNYFPLKVLGDARYQEQDVNVPDSETLPSTITGNIIKRRKNTLPLDILHTDALSLAIEHVEDMERWAAQAEWNKEVNTLLSYTTFRNKVKNMDTIYGSGDALWNTFKDAAKIAAGTYNPSVKSGHVDTAISNIAKGVTAAKINFRVYTAFKQILSAPAFLHDVNLADFVHDAVNPYGSWKWAMENMPVFKKRWQSRQVGDTRLMDDPTDWKLWKTNIVQMATRLGMSPNALVDGVTCAVGARSIYKSRYKKYKEIGASEETAKKRALQDAEIGYNLTQQSSEGAFVSAIQKDRTVAANMLSVFRNSSMAYTRQWVDAARNLKKRSQKGYKEDAIKFMTRQMQENFDLEEDQAKKAAELEYAREGRRDIARMLNMMFGVTVAWNLGASLPYLLIGDDDHTKKEMLTDALMKGLIAGPTEGMAAGNIWSDLIGRTLASEETRNTFKSDGIGAALDAALKQGGDYEVNPLPLMADIQSMIKKMGYDKYAAAQDVFNIVMQSAVGANPQTFTDMWNAAMDYGAPGWDGRSYYPDDENLTRPKELALFMMRVLNAPTSSWRNKYIDELGMNAEDAQKLPYEEMVRRYAHYKHWKDAPIMGWLRSDEARQDKMAKIQKQFDKAVEERMKRLSDEELMHNVARSESPDEKRKYAKMIAQRLGVNPGSDSQKAKDDEWYQSLYQQKMSYEDVKEDLVLADKYKNLENVFKEKREEAERKSVQDLKEFNQANKEWKDRIDEAKKEAKKRMDWIRGGKWNTPSGKKGSSKKAELLTPGKKQLETSDDEEAIMKNIRQWRKEALEILMKAESQ